MNVLGCTATATDCTPRTEELRLALVLNGGVSLAVWMGGVAHELNRLVRETHPVYRGLLELTATAARIDVISGTSAGGINGAALALAQLHDRSLYPMRDVWLNTAGLQDLLREPEGEPSSLLRGNDWFLPRIKDAFVGLAQGALAPAEAVPLVLNLTSTLLDPMSNQWLDDFGAVIEDSVHRARWSFEHLPAASDPPAGQAPPRSDFEHPQIVAQLALAARATASFPIAFEPAEYNPGSDEFKGCPRLSVLKPALQPVASQVLLLDGGILNNQPFDAALDGIARLPANGNTRRVLAYIVPDPAPAAEPRKPGLDGKLPMPTLADVASRSLIGIPATQSIAAQLTRLRDHNHDASRRWQRIVGAMRHAGPATLQAQAGAMLQTYRERRLDGVIDYLLEEVQAGLTEPQYKGQMDMRRATRQWLRSTWRATGDADPALWTARVPQSYDPKQPLVSAANGRWPWGLYALQFMAQLTVELLRRTQRLHGLVARWHQADDEIVPGPALAQRPDSTCWELRDGGASPARAALAGGVSRVVDGPLRDVWQQAYRLEARANRRRHKASGEASKVGAACFVALVEDWKRRGGEEPPTALANAMIHSLLVDGSEADQPANAADALALCTVLAELRPVIEDILQAHDLHAGRQVRADIAESVIELRHIHGYLYLPDGEFYLYVPPDEVQAELPLVDRIAWRVLALEVFEVAAGSRRSDANAQAEVVQISARQSSAWGGSRLPVERVTGVQLAHFGAFYKRSWRANDWTFGRLDGIDRAVRIALNPDALQRRFAKRRVATDASDAVGQPASAYVLAFLRHLAVDSAEEALVPLLRARWEADEPQIKVDLQWLDSHSSLPPPVLERCAAALTRRLQLEALRAELPEIARSLMQEMSAGAPPSIRAGAPLLARLAPRGELNGAPPPEVALALIETNLLGSDALAMQPGTDLFTRTASQGLATTHAALSSRHGGLNIISALFKVTAWPVRILYWLANRLSQVGSTGAALEGGALGIGGALVAAGMFSAQLPSAAVGLGWALLVGAIGTTLLRRMWIGLLVALLVLVAALLVKHALLWQGLVLVAAIIVLLQPFSAVATTICLVLAAVWWSAGGSSDALVYLWQTYSPWSTAPTPAVPVTETWTAMVASAERLKLALGPALLLVVVLLVSALSRKLSALGQRKGWLLVDEARLSLQAWWKPSELQRRMAQRQQEFKKRQP
jgi:patatin-related protein